MGDQIESKDSKGIGAPFSSSPTGVVSPGTSTPSPAISLSASPSSHLCMLGGGLIFCPGWLSPHPQRCRAFPSFLHEPAPARLCGQPRSSLCPAGPASLKPKPRAAAAAGSVSLVGMETRAPASRQGGVCVSLSAALKGSCLFAAGESHWRQARRGDGHKRSSCIKALRLIAADPSGPWPLPRTASSSSLSCSQSLVLGWLGPKLGAGLMGGSQRTPGE